MGLSLEEQGPMLRFLMSFVYASEDSLTFAPFHPNLRFVSRCEQFQHVARVGQFQGPKIHSFSTLHMYMLGKVLAYDYILLGREELFMVHMGLVVHELLLLHWLEHWIMNSVSRIPPNRTSPFVRAFRSLMKYWRFCPFGYLFPIQVLL